MSGPFCRRVDCKIWTLKIENKRSFFFHTNLGNMFSILVNTSLIISYINDQYGSVKVECMDAAFIGSP